MRKFVIAAALAAVATPSAPLLADPPGWAPAHGQRDKDYRKAQKEWRKERREAWRDYGRYDYNRVDPRYGSYHADRYYRDGRYYEPRRLSYNDRIYRGQDGRYYCRRSDGTTGLIIGGIGGGALGNIIAPGGSKTLGTILGAGAGALIGRAIDRDNVRCR
ncbi:hypothetical protein CLG96_01275 [Sphingomonas oleivorans]|uniref:17 kDa surface antigen n=1 Tax=Sphingomonas oleivorans TaxID=1735121 RepID=A0A2T5G0Z0_9SPHN|nr:hypothetical protein [Sphingomonas oleivorans]PTQ12807.1 hypothetical protein CLG96_01275 [Sphingomonas oleivorans]